LRADVSARLVIVKRNYYYFVIIITSESNSSFNVGGFLEMLSAIGPVKEEHIGELCRTCGGCAPRIGRHIVCEQFIPFREFGHLRRHC
jgi:hypothetical protein